jgi:hypothetical protein
LTTICKRKSEKHTAVKILETPHGKPNSEKSSPLESHNKTHGFGLKMPLLPNPLHSPIGGRGKGVLSLKPLIKICLIKT